MNYELAKELKDSGFPQDTEKVYVWNGFSDDRSKHISIVGMGAGAHYSKDYIVANPTLSELIAACGWHLHSLHTDEEINGNTVWFATLKYDSRKFIPNENYRKGETPEEAVAKLWLALNKKND